MTIEHHVDDAQLRGMLAFEREAAFAAGVRSVVHALGTPVNVILGHVELCDGEPSNLSTSDLEVIAREARRMAAALAKLTAFIHRVGLASTPSAPVAARELTAWAGSVAPRSPRPVTLDIDGVDEELQLSIAPFLPWLSGLIEGAQALADDGGRVAIELTEREGRLATSVDVSPSSVAEVTGRSLSEPWLHADDAGSARAQLALGSALAAVRARGGKFRVESGGGDVRLRIDLPVGPHG